MERKRVLGFWDLLFFSFSAIFGVEAIAASAAIGPSAISWWLICIIGYFLPFGLISAELGSTYPEQGGIYVWTKKALGVKWGARSVWYYWTSLPLWLPAIYIAIADVIGHIFFPNMGLWGKILMGIVLTWIAVGINLCPLKVSKWIPNFGTVTRFLVIAGMIYAAVIYFLKNGHFANEINLANITPNLNTALVFIPVIIYNLEGCELVSAASAEIKNPARDIPKAVILSALVIALLYLVTTFTFWVVIPVKEINVASGILHMFTVAFSGHAMGYFISLAASLLISSTLYAGIVTWSLAENRTVAESAGNGDLPGILGKLNGNMAPLGAAVVSGIISTVVIILYGLIARSAAELFWHVISFSLIVGLFSYSILFPVFIILRKRDKEIKRPYRIPGPDWVAILLAVIAEVFIVAAVLLLLIQPGHDFMRFSLPIIFGVLIMVLLGEICISRSAGKPALAKQ